MALARIDLQVPHHEAAHQLNRDRHGPLWPQPLPHKLRRLSPMKCDSEPRTFTDIRLPQAVLAEGKPLAAGSYQARITSERPAPAVGQSATAACWIAFVNGGIVAGREVASIVSAEDIGDVAKGSAPKPDAARVDPSAARVGGPA